MLISSAFAQTAGAAAGQPGLFQSIMPLVLIFGVFYFLLIRPQQKKMKMHKEMLGSLRRGDRIVTGGGILGTVTKVIGDGELVVQIAEGVKVRVDRGLVSSVIAKPEAADKTVNNDDDDSSDDDSSDDDAEDSKDSTDSQDSTDSKDESKSKDGLKKLLSE